MQYIKRKRIALMMALYMIASLFMSGKTQVYAAVDYSNYSIKPSKSEVTMYTNQVKYFIGATISMFGSDDDFVKNSEKIRKDLMWESSNPSVVAFVTEVIYEGEENRYKTAGKISPDGLNPGVMALSEGTSTITIKSKLLNQSCKCKVTVKNAELICDRGLYYDKNTYHFSVKGNATGISYASSNPKVAVIDEKTGVVTTLKQGTTVLSCVADDGNTYEYNLQVQKRGLNYTKLSTYYYTGFREGCYSYFPLVAKGIDVKKWKSSNKKVCEIQENGNVGILKMLNTGKTTITCVGKDGSKFQCRVTVVGGKPWGGLQSGYVPTLSELKTHGYYKDINSIMDYGNVVICMHEYDHDINLKNGNKRLSRTEIDEAELILSDRYPGKTVRLLCGGDHVLFNNDKRTKIGRIWFDCYYVNPEETAN